MVNYVTPFEGSLASVDLAGLLSANPRLVNDFGDSAEATFGVSNTDSELQTGEPTEASIGGAPAVPINYIGAGQLSFLNISLGSFPSLGELTIAINPISVGLFTLDNGGIPQNYLVSQVPLDAANLTASASFGTTDLAVADLTELVSQINALIPGGSNNEITINDILNAALTDLDITPGEPFPVTNPEVICFGRGTLIRTADGDRPVEDLAAGDLVLTAGNGLQAIRWIGSQMLSGLMLQSHPSLRPIRIRAGALGPDTPSADLIVSPQHRILVRSRIAQKIFGTDEVLVAAKQLLQLDGIDVADDLDQVEYFHFMFDRHEVVLSNGAETEALFTGPEALKAVGASARQELLALFPDIAAEDYEAVPARILASGRMGRRLAVRHLQNHRPLVEAL